MEKFCIENSSLGEIDPKVVETTSPMEDVQVDEKDTVKENYLGHVQGKTHDKMSNKAVVDLTPISKEI